MRGPDGDPGHGIVHPVADRQTCRVAHPTIHRGAGAPRSGTIRAIVQDRYGSADVLELKDIPAPMLGDDDVLVRVHAAGCGPDVWHLMTGRPYFARLMVGFRDTKVGIRRGAAGARRGAAGARSARARPARHPGGGGCSASSRAPSPSWPSPLRTSWS